MGRLGIGTLGDARRPRARPGRRPLRAGRACAPCGSPAARSAPLRPRRPHEELAEEIELPEGTAGSQLERALELLVDRLLAAPQRRGRTLLGAAPRRPARRRRQLERRAGAGRPTASARVLRAVLAPRLEALPAPGGAAAAAGARPRPAGRATSSSSRSAARSRAAVASATRCARCAPRRAPRRCSGCCRSTPPPACPSGARC